MFRGQTTQLWGSSCDLLEAQVLPTGLALRYTSPGRAVLVLTRRPQEISVDGQPVTIPVEGHGDEWTILAPRGEHRLEVRTFTRAGLAVNWSSWILSSVLAAFGAVATLFMLWFYAHLRVRPTGRWRQSAE